MLRQKTAIRKHQITEAAHNLIASRGMEALTIDAIAEKIGLTDGAIYRHFTSKKQILSLLMDDVEETFVRTIAEAQKEEFSGIHNLHRIYEAQMQTAEPKMAIKFMVILEAVAFDGIGLASRVGSIMTAYLNSIAQVITAGKNDGSIGQSVNEIAAATTFFGLIQSTATLWNLNDYTYPPPDTGEQMWAIFKRGIEPEVQLFCPPSSLDDSNGSRNTY